jgi:hypothetical protein
MPTQSREASRVAVDSASIASVGYDSAARELEVAFRESGDVYRYFDVPGDEYARLMAAESMGTYFNQVFKRRGFAYVVVARGRDKAALDLENPPDHS